METQHFRSFNSQHSSDKSEKNKYNTCFPPYHQLPQDVNGSHYRISRNENDIHSSVTVPVINESNHYMSSMHSNPVDSLNINMMHSVPSKQTDTSASCMVNVSKKKSDKTEHMNESAQRPCFINKFSPYSVSSNGFDSTKSSRNSESYSHMNGVDIKLFVTGLPSSFTDEDLKNLFSEFGNVLEANLLRDTEYNFKGSGFVHMSSINDADVAIRVLSNHKILDPCLGPIQIDYAQGEPERLGFTPGALIPGESEAKLFVGSLPSDLNEDDILHFFSQYGIVHDPYIMRDPVSNRLKNCGFIKFAEKEQALLAVKKLNGAVTFRGAARPLEVRVAEPKRGYHNNQHLGNQAMASRVTMSPPNNNYSIQNPTNQHWNSNVTSTGLPSKKGRSVIHPHPTFFIAHSNKNQLPMQSMYACNSSNVVHHSNVNPRTVGPWKEYFTIEGRPYYYNEHLRITQWEVPPEFSQHLYNKKMQRKRKEGNLDMTGPRGANIFIFHVPNEWMKEDLVAHFAPYGYVISAKVALNPHTQRNKGYGFVSYNNVRSAIQAVQHMNFMVIGNKRLRVAIKNGEEEHAIMYAQTHGLSYPNFSDGSSKMNHRDFNSNSYNFSSDSGGGTRQDISHSIQSHIQSTHLPPSIPKMSSIQHCDVYDLAEPSLHYQMSTETSNTIYPLQSNAKIPISASVPVTSNYDNSLWNTVQDNSSNVHAYHNSLIQSSSVPKRNGTGSCHLPTISTINSNNDSSSVNTIEHSKSSSNLNAGLYGSESNFPLGNLGENQCHSAANLVPVNFKYIP